MTTGMKIKIARVKANLTLRELADLTKLNIATLSHIENDRVKPSAITLNKIAKALKLELGDLLK